MAKNQIELQVFKSVIERYSTTNNTIATAKNLLFNIKNNTDREVLDRNSLQMRLSKLISDIEAVGKEVLRIKKTLTEILNTYQTVQNDLKNQMASLEMYASITNNFKYKSNVSKKCEKFEIIVDHLSSLSNLTVESFLTIGGSFQKIFYRFPLEVQDLEKFGLEVIDSLGNILQEMWVVDAACTVFENTHSLLSGAEKYLLAVNADALVGNMTDYDFSILMPAIIFSNLRTIFGSKNNLDNTDLKQLDNYSKNIIDVNRLSDYIEGMEEEKAYEFVSNIILSSNEQNFDLGIDVLQVYYKKMSLLYPDIAEYQEILSTIDDFKSDRINKEVALQRIYRLHVQSDVDLSKQKFYQENDLGKFIDDNSQVKYNDQLLLNLEEQTELNLISYAHTIQNFTRGFYAGAIPFVDLISKPFEYDEGSYFSDSLGKETFQRIANKAYKAGEKVGFATSVAVDISIFFMTGGAGTLAKSLTKTNPKLASVLFKTDDLFRVDDFVKMANFIDKAKVK